MFKKIIEEWCIPDNHSRQVTSDVLANNLFSQENHIKVVMDLGCGEGSSIDFFRKLDQDIRWTGLDIENSPEVAARTKTGAEFYSFDGVNIPFDNNYFDLIYCNQVLEHVKHPVELLKEVQRVLKPNGYFIGSTSQLEPYHSYSLWNYTPYGFRLLLEEAHLQLIEIRPGIDALTMIIRTGLGRPKFFARWWKRESPLNKIISFAGWLTRKSNKEINFAKLIFCGQFCFLVQKSNEAA